MRGIELEEKSIMGRLGEYLASIRKKLSLMISSFRSAEGYSSHIHNPFFALVSLTTTESTGEA